MSLAFRSAAEVRVVTDGAEEAATELPFEKVELGVLLLLLVTALELDGYVVLHC